MPFQPELGKEDMLGGWVPGRGNGVGGCAHLLLPSLLSPTALVYLEISWYYLVTQIIKMLRKIAYEPTQFPHYNYMILLFTNLR